MLLLDLTYSAMIGLKASSLSGAFIGELGGRWVVALMSEAIVLHGGGGWMASEYRSSGEMYPLCC